MSTTESSIKEVLQTLSDAKKELCVEFDTLKSHRSKIVERKPSRYTLDIISKSVISLLEKVDELFQTIEASTDTKGD